jgi:hypothetical protein
LWPETIKAVRQAMKARPDPKDEADDGLVFLSRCGVPWVRVQGRDTGYAIVRDAVADEFSKLLKELGLKRQGVAFYALRHAGWLH